MQLSARFCLLCLSLVWTAGPAQDASSDVLRILSWNISSDAFDAEAEEFQALVRWAAPDILLLDEVSPHADIEKLRAALDLIESGVTWHINHGESGGRQRGVIASRAPQENVSEFSGIVSYPEDERHALLSMMPAKDRRDPNWSMDGGIPVNAAIINTGNRRLLVVIADLQCCGGGPDSWNEYRRQVEATEIRRRVEAVLERTDVDGIIVAGDFNTVSGPAAIEILAGTYGQSGLLDKAEMKHENGLTWTWDGRGMPFPSNVLDFQLYSAKQLTQLSGLILDTETATPEQLDDIGLDPLSSRQTGRHRPLVGDYQWRDHNDE